MTPYVAVDLSHYSPWQEGSKSALWWGTVVLVAITATVYAALIASYFYLRQGADEWPPGYIPVPGLLWPTVGTALRLASEPFLFFANRSAKTGNRVEVVLGLAIANVLAIGWMVQVVEYYFSLPFDWTYATYASIVWTMQAWAFICTASMIIWGLIALAWAVTGHFNAERRAGLQSLKMYWTAQTICWIFFWLVIYFGPRVFHKP